MGGHDAVLQIGPRPHFLGTAKEDPDLPPAHLGEELRLLRLRVGVVDKGNLLRRDAQGGQLRLDIVVDAEYSIAFGGRQVAKQQLCPQNVLAVLPLPENIFDAGVNFALRIIRQQRIL